MLALFATVILYTQLLVATPGGRNVALLWSDEEVAQGFAWDKEVVAFGLPDHDGSSLVRVQAQNTPFILAGDALWAVSVPFAAREGVVDVGTVLGERSLPIQPGDYQLVFQARPGNGEHSYVLDVVFIRGGAQSFAILKQGELESGEVLRRQARRQ
ncbi:hypothetical protein HMPREF9946_01555 [Acetobacteraceae bacterium AT-5844]|nr:hypothetical protein HMPREF9946_01555 [Acetobacteraceae bacterium AT-5844]